MEIHLLFLPLGQSSTNVSERNQSQQGQRKYNPYVRTKNLSNLSFVYFHFQCLFLRFSGASCPQSTPHLLAVSCYLITLIIAKATDELIPADSSQNLFKTRLQREENLESWVSFWVKAQSKSYIKSLPPATPTLLLP